MVKKIFVIPPDQIDTMRHPEYPEGDNRSRNAFMWNLASKQGKVFQRVVKPAIIKTIGMIHSWILKSWDPEGYIYDDPRMKHLDENLHGFISEYYNHQERKLNFMHQAIDIGLFILKEDIYYRGRILHMLNQLPIFEITPAEIVNMKTFRDGVGSIDYASREVLENAVKSDIKNKEIVG